MKRIVFVSAIFSFSCSMACAGSLPATILAPAAVVDEACKTLPAEGVTCVLAGQDISPANLGSGSISMSSNSYFFFDKNDRPAIKGFLILTPSQTSGGHPYYEATPQIFKRGFAGIGVTHTDLYDKPFWESVGARFSVAPTGSAQEISYLARMDGEIDQRQRDEAARTASKSEADAKSAAAAAYRASPEYAAAQRQRQVEACRSTIANAKRAIAQDQRVAQISGYENKVLREQAAVAIVNCEDFLQSAHAAL